MLPSSLILVVDEDTLFSRPALVFILAFKFNRCLAVASFARIRAFALVRSLLNVDVALFSAKATTLNPLKKAEKKTHKKKRALRAFLLRLFFFFFFFFFRVLREGGRPKGVPSSSSSSSPSSLRRFYIE
tara:strand:- start:135 stop:521 length:387 start_codon:yes stop_codon:yes gene_type:complete